MALKEKGEVRRLREHGEGVEWLTERKNKHLFPSRSRIFLLFT